MDRDAIRPTGRLIPANLTDGQLALLARVKESNLTSYALKESELEDAAALVRGSLAFYSMDRNHITSYRIAHHG